MTTTTDMGYQDVVAPSNISFSRLGSFPFELTDAIFSFVRSRKDQGNVRLVCRKWDKIMLPRMWYTFESLGLESTATKTFSDLLNSPRNIPRHIRSISIQPNNWRSSPSGSVTDDESHRNLSLLLNALKRDSLKKFATGDGLESATFLDLLSAQGRLEQLCVYLDFSDMSLSANWTMWFGTHKSFIASRLTEVHDLTIIDHIMLSIYDDATMSHYGALVILNRFFLANTPALTHLTICSDTYERTVGPDFLKDLLVPYENRTLFSKVDLLKLKNLVLSQVNFRKRSDAILRSIDIGTLHCLELDACRNFAVLLEDIGHVLDLLQEPLLSELKVRFRPQSLDTIGLGAVEALLNSRIKLREINVHSAAAGLVEKGCIIRHADTLQSLTLSLSQTYSTHYYPLNALQAILEKCQFLEALAIDLPHHGLGNVDECNLSWSLHDDAKSLELRKELRGVLDAIATVRNLHTLRILSAELDGLIPNQALTTRQISFAQAIFSNYASQILRYLAERGSKVKVLAISPIYNDWVGDNESEKDANGHRYPHYYYLRARITDHLGRTKVVAEPIENCLAEIPELDILSVD